jgi:glycosyltransferase involved in cell wall biosynthesis
LFEERRLEQRLLKWGGNWHDRILTIGSQAQAQLKNFTSQEIFVVGEGLSHAELFYPRPRPAPGPAKTVLFLGDMRPRKGLQDFITAAELIYPQIPGLELWVVSKDPCAIETPVPFRYIHRPSRKELAELYARCDLFVSASWLESFGLPPLEAMACGAPVVLTDSGGVREYAHHEVNCLMVPPRCPEALAQAMCQTLTDTALAQRFRQNGPTTAAKFTWQAAVDRFEEVLK